MILACGQRHLLVQTRLRCVHGLLQGVTHFKDIRYTDGITYGELFMQNEYEMGRYNLDEADVQVQRQRFALYEQVRMHHLLLLPPSQFYRLFWRSSLSGLNVLCQR